MSPGLTGAFIHCQKYEAFTRKVAARGESNRYVTSVPHLLVASRALAAPFRLFISPERTPESALVINISKVQRRRSRDAFARNAYSPR